MNSSEHSQNEPNEETRAAAEPIQEELEDTLSGIDTPEKAQTIVDKIVEDTNGKRAVDAEADVSKSAPPEEQAKEAAETVARAADHSTDNIDEAAAVLEAAAAEAAALEGESYEAVTQAIQEITNPELQRQPEKLKRPRRYLLDAILRHPGISLAAKIDTELFVLINVYTPRSPALDAFYRRLSFVFTGGWIYLIAMALLWPFRPRWTWQTLKRIAPPIWAAAFVVEGPIKKYFVRRRPFIDIVRAVVVGKKPGNWSFPSGHASAAFGGAYIIGKCIPALRPLLYTLATLVAYSRIYLGAHYPGDVLSGSLFGIGLAQLTDQLVRRPWRKKKK